MFGFIKKKFIRLLSFAGSLAFDRPERTPLTIITGKNCVLFNSLYE